MVERGEIELDAPFQKYVPTFPVKPEGPITVRELAGHLTGNDVVCNVHQTLGSALKAEVAQNCDAV